MGLRCRNVTFLFRIAFPTRAGRYPSPTQSPQRLRQKMLELLMVWLSKEAERRPVLTVWGTFTGAIHRRWKPTIS